jgi:hypothetical protein
MVAIPKRHDVELTGRARVRPGWRGRLILQVEVNTATYSACPPIPGSNPHEWRERMRRDGYQTLHWRDAVWNDMHALHRLDLVPPGSIEPARPWPRGINVNPPPDYPRPPAPPPPPPVGRPGAAASEPSWWAGALNRRATVEQAMFDAARGKRPMPTADELRAWAIKLGTPEQGEPTTDV